jgi:hypothetical protein
VTVGKPTEDRYAQIESVVIPPPPFHPALAMVHRASSHTHFVLQETGQVVGNTEEGIVPIWQGILGCDECGNEVGSSDAFWQGWEERLFATE